MNLFKNKSIRLLALKEPGTSPNGLGRSVSGYSLKRFIDEDDFRTRFIDGIRFGNKDDIVEVRDTSI